jgi:YggT family protein
VAWVILFYILEVMKWLVIARAIASWFVSPHSDNRLVEGLRVLTDPLIAPVRAVLPDTGGVDLSPLAVFFLIILLQGLITRVAMM